MTKEKIKPVKRLSVLENYYFKGWLNMSNTQWSADDRLKAGQRLYGDYYRSHRISRYIDYEKPRVDSSAKTEPEYLLDARDRFNKAIQSIPADYWPEVREVCCYNRLIKGRGLTKRQQLYDRYMQMCDLCRGLDYLIRFYLRIGKKVG